jgi:thioredoxin 2
VIGCLFSAARRSSCSLLDRVEPGGPAFAAAAQQLQPAARLAKVNTEEEQALAARFAMRSIPTLVVFRKGREVTRQAGAMDAASIVRWLRSLR